ncbi:MAG: RNA degradosome polyphosphate kinase, partial [Hyphomicrobiaceae bacterium]
MSGPSVRAGGNVRKTAVAEPAPPGGPDRFYNRELSWLQFNRRVLEEAQNRSHPLLERLRFLSISASNLDEFYMVRAAGLLGQVRANANVVSVDGLSPAQQLAEINRFAAGLIADKQACWLELRHALAEAGIEIVDADGLSGEEHEYLRQHFITHIFPILTPLNVDPAHPFPFIQNKGLTLVLEMTNGEGRSMVGLIPIPAMFDRFVRLPSPAGSRVIRFVRIEIIIGLFLDHLFPTFVIGHQGTFRVLRDSDIEFQEEAEDLIRAFEDHLRRRRRGNVIRLELEASMPDELKLFVISAQRVQPEVVFEKNGVLGLADTEQLIVADRPDLLFKPFQPRFPERIREHG